MEFQNESYGEIDCQYNHARHKRVPLAVNIARRRTYHDRSVSGKQIAPAKPREEILRLPGGDIEAPAKIQATEPSLRALRPEEGT